MPAPPRSARRPAFPLLVGRAAVALFVSLTTFAGLAAPVAGQEPSTDFPKAPPLPDLTGKVALVTGSTDGLGRDVARRLAAAGAQVLVTGRSGERGEALVDEIAKSGRGSARFYRADLVSLAETRGLADAVIRDHRRLDLLINNAGVGLVFDTTRKFSADGHELHFAVNYLAHYLLTQRLLPLLVASAPSRIINVSSGSQAPIDFDDVMMAKGVHRGTTTMATTMARALNVRPRSTIAEGVESVVNAITTTEPTGTYFNQLKPVRAHAQAYDAEARARLTAISEQLVRER